MIQTFGGAIRYHMQFAPYLKTEDLRKRIKDIISHPI